jgi:hypothetical protein
VPLASLFDVARGALVEADRMDQRGNGRRS